MIEASPLRGTPEQWTAEQAARAMGVVDEADGEGLVVEGAASGEIGHEQPNARGGVRWVAGGTALTVVAAAAWWSGAGNRDSREIPVHAGADGALIAGERTPNSGPGDFNSSNGSSHMKIQTTAAAALLGAAAGATALSMSANAAPPGYVAVADSQAQFSGVQGQGGWWYLFDRGEGTALLPIPYFTPYNATPDNGAYAWCPEPIAGFGGSFCMIHRTWSHTNQAYGCDTPQAGLQRPTRRWMASRSTPIIAEISAILGGPNTSALRVDVLADSHVVRSWTTYYGSVPTINATIELASVQQLDFRLDPIDGCAADGCGELMIQIYAPDCNGDSVADYLQLEAGTLPDYNGNDIPDCCDQGVQCTVGSYPVQWRVEDGGNGHWYQHVPDLQSFTWHQQRAVSRGASVVCIADLTENQFVWNLVHAIEPGPFDRTIWIGLIQDPIGGEPDQGWSWIDGAGSTYRNWLPSEPNNYPPYEEDNCRMIVSMEPSPYQGTWQDYAEASQFASVIEWSADCNSDGIVDYGQLVSGQLADTNTNGIPDICECATHPELGACRCVGDIVTDGIVNGADLGTLLAYWGLTTSVPYSQASDINVDGRVDGADLGRLLSNWGACQYSGVTVPAWATLIEAMPDPAVVTNPALRTAIAATGLAWRVRDTGTGIEMLLVPPGTFQMGCSQRSDSFPCVEWELPVHAVTITKPFYLGRHEVTQQQWGASMGSNPSTFQGRVDSDWRPVETVSWNAVQPYLAATNMRLPTEAEWEYACRAGTTTAFSNGSNDDSTIGSIAWWGSCCGGNSGGETRPVGTKPGNALGLNDMLGNVWEWVSDWFANYPTDAQVDPLGPTSGQLKPLRGGSWADDTHYVHSSYRYEAATPYNAYPQAGFRVARNP